MKKALRIALMLALLIAVFGIASAQDEVKLIRMDIGETDIPTLDPALATDTSSIQVINETYIGLTYLNVETLAVEPGMATSWETVENEDGTVTYTFTLMEGVPWVKFNQESGEVEEVTDADGNVRYVTAADFEYGMKRTLDPRTAGDYAYVLAPQIVGGNEFNTQDIEGADEEGFDLTTADLMLTADTVAVSATGEYTLELTAPQFFAFQLNIYGMWMARPQPSWVIEEFGDFWIEDENFVSYGPYAVQEWAHDESLTLIANPFWAGTEAVPAAKVTQVQLLILPASTAMAEYEAGNLEFLDNPPLTDLARIKADPVLSAEYSQDTSGCTYYYGFSVGVEPFTNVHIRRAFSFAIDRQSLVDNVLQGGQTPAGFFSNPTLAAKPFEADYPELAVTFDPEIAIEELELGLEEMGLDSVADLPPITLAFNTSESHQTVAEAIASNWEEVLGVQVQLTNQEWAVFLESRGEFPVWRSGWCQDYPDTHNFLFDVFHSTSNNNDTGWTNEEYDALIEEAASLTDLDARTELYAEAEGILVYEDAAVAPIYYYSDLSLTKPNVERVFSRTGSQQFEKWDINN